MYATYLASKRTSGTNDFYAAGRSLTGFQNGLAIAGDYLSAASFLGIAGLVALYGYDGFMYSVGWLMGYLIVLFIIAEPSETLVNLRLRMLSLIVWNNGRFVQRALL